MAVYNRNGYWYVDITINKKRRRVSVPEASTKRQAEQAERVLRDEIFNKRFGIGGDRLFKAFIEESFIPHVKADHKGFTTELSKINRLVEHFGAMRLHEITPEAIEQFKRKIKSETTIRKTPRAPATVDRILAVLSGVFTLAVKFGEVKENPVRRVDYFHQHNHKDRVMTASEETTLFAALADEPMFYRIVKILLYTGMRRGELFQIEWRDVDFDKGFITLRGETTKTSKPRVIPLFAHILEIFKTIRAEAGEPGELAQVFASYKPRAEYLSRRFTDLCKSLGITGVTIHTLRHTFSTRAFERGINGLAHQALMGHSTMQMTSRYTHVTPEMIKDSLSGWQQELGHTTAAKNEDQPEKSEESPKVLEFKKPEKN